MIPTVPEQLKSFSYKCHRWAVSPNTGSSGAGDGGVDAASLSRGWHKVPGPVGARGFGGGIDLFWDQIPCLTVGETSTVGLRTSTFLWYQSHEGAMCVFSCHLTACVNRAVSFASPRFTPKFASPKCLALD